MGKSLRTAKEEAEAYILYLKERELQKSMSSLIRIEKEADK